ncbi:hypothetical protein [Pseudonocardia sp. DLS-67]
MTRRRVNIVLIVLAATVAAGCASGPVDRNDLCEGFDRLDEAVATGNTGIGNPLFEAAGDLADLADGYPGGHTSTDASALRTIADSDSTDINELRNATMQTSTICERPPVGLGGLMGGRK